MLPEISLNVLDVAMNSVRAEASLICILVQEDTKEGLLRIRIEDNGCGMTASQTQAVTDPFFTTRSSRKVGLGVPFLKQAAEASGGTFSIESEPGRGTSVAAEFDTGNIDCMPLGDICTTVHQLITMYPDMDFLYDRRIDDSSFVLDTRQMREILGGVPFNEPDVSEFIRSYLEENEAELRSVETGL